MKTTPTIPCPWCQGDRGDYITDTEAAGAGGSDFYPCVPCHGRGYLEEGAYADRQVLEEAAAGLIESATNLHRWLLSDLDFPAVRR